ncbi:MAG: hypothetical protein JXR40_08895 [Pontiellaceae bacterium]|nr:hypothetical protein [Pontiellaceae bacterium]
MTRIKSSVVSMAAHAALLVFIFAGGAEASNCPPDDEVNLRWSGTLPAYLRCGDAISLEVIIDGHNGGSYSWSLASGDPGTITPCSNGNEAVFQAASNAVGFVQIYCIYGFIDEQSGENCSYYAFHQLYVVGGDMYFDSNNDGVANSSDNATEESPGGIIFVNDDDDNNNGVLDYWEIFSPYYDRDLLYGQVKLPNIAPAGGQILVRQLSGHGKVAVYTSLYKSGGPLDMSSDQIWYAGNCPASLYIEGYEASDGIGDVQFQLWYSYTDEYGTTITETDLIALTVLYLDLGVDSNNDGFISSDDNAIEDNSGTLGFLICKNDDHDNGNQGLPDCDDEVLANYLDVFDCGIMELSLMPCGLPSGSVVELSVNDSSKVRIFRYTDSYPINPYNHSGWDAIIGPSNGSSWTRTLSAAPYQSLEYFLIEGVDPGLVEITVSYKIPNGSGGFYKTFSDKVRATILSVDIDKIAFNYKPASATDDALNIRDDFTTAISVPEYVKVGQNKPAAYIKNKAVKMLVRLKVEPSSTITSLKIKGVSDDTNGSLGNATEKTVTFSGGISQEGTDDASTTGIDESEYVEFTITGNTPNKVFKSEEAWKWIVTEVNGTAVSDMEVERTSGHEVYVLWDTPKSPWNQTSGNAQNPWVAALSFVIETANAHDKNDAGTLAAITSFLHTGHGLKYDIFGRGAPAYANLNAGTFDLTNYLNPPPLMRELTYPYDFRDGDIVCCYDQAGGVNVLSTLVGINTDLVYMNPFGYIQKTDLVGWGSCNNPFPANETELLLGTDGVTDLVKTSTPKRKNFGNHAFVDAGGNILDACAGPHSATESYLAYCTASIDISSDAESAASADLNIDHSFSAVEVNSVRLSPVISVIK